MTTQRDDEDALTRAIIQLASEYGRYGDRRITVLLQRAGWNVGRDRVQRIWRREGLRVPEKQKPRGRLWLNEGSCVRLRPEHENHVWRYDFVSSLTHDGRTLRVLDADGRVHAPVPGPADTGRSSLTATPSRRSPRCQGSKRFR